MGVEGKGWGKRVGEKGQNKLMGSFFKNLLAVAL
jgi:hypothetical protein